jgi:hypothetical protein
MHTFTVSEYRLIVKRRLLLPHAARMLMLYSDPMASL